MGVPSERVERALLAARLELAYAEEQEEDSHEQDRISTLLIEIDNMLFRRYSS